MASVRKQIRDERDDSPSLRPYLSEIFEPCYTDARDIAAARSQRPLSPLSACIALAASRRPRHTSA